MKVPICPQRRSKMTEIKGKKLAWAIIHLQFFLYIGWVDFGDISNGFSLFLIMIMFFLAWRFIENMGEAFA